MVLHPLSKRMVVLRYESAFSRLPPFAGGCNMFVLFLSRPLPKDFFFWKVPQDMYTKEIVRNNSIVEVQIARNLPVFESRQASA
jgi:hypothetical protein